MIRLNNIIMHLMGCLEITEVLQVVFFIQEMALHHYLPCVCVCVHYCIIEMKDVNSIIYNVYCCTKMCS